MEWPKRARTVSWESGVLTLDGEKQFEVPELTAEIMNQLAGYTLVGFHVKGYPVTDELLAPFAGHKSMANFGVEDSALTDACFPVFSAMPKLRYLLLDGNAAIHGSGLPALQGCKLDLLTLNRTGLDDAGLLQAASIPKLSHIQIDHMLIDTVGMSTLFLPDLQYHFHGMDPNWVVNHAYNVASYILEHDIMMVTIYNSGHRTSVL